MDKKQYHLASEHLNYAAYVVQSYFMDISRHYVKYILFD